MSRLISCILPTRGRQQWAAQAVECFERQTYPNRELLIIDDADDPSFPDMPSASATIYRRIPQRWTIGRKRNELIECAMGSVICHFDSDDWSHKDRLASQLHLLLESEKAVCAFHSMPFVDEADRRAWKYSGRPTNALGTSLMYFKAWWSKHPFNGTKYSGEDEDFAQIARDHKQLVSIDAYDLMVARVHSGNISPKHPRQSPSYTPVAWTDLPPEFRLTTQT